MQKTKLRLLSILEVAEMTGLGVTTIRREYRRKNSPLRALRMTDAPNAPIRFREADVLAWIESRERQHAPAPTARRDARAASDPAAFADDDAAARRQGGGA